MSDRPPQQPGWQQPPPQAYLPPTDMRQSYAIDPKHGRVPHAGISQTLLVLASSIILPALGIAVGALFGVIGSCSSVMACEPSPAPWIAGFLLLVVPVILLIGGWVAWVMQSRRRRSSLVYAILALVGPIVPTLIAMVILFLWST